MFAYPYLCSYYNYHSKKWDVNLSWKKPNPLSEYALLIPILLFIHLLTQRSNLITWRIVRSTRWRIMYIFRDIH